MSCRIFSPDEKLRAAICVPGLIHVSVNITRGLITAYGDLYHEYWVDDGEYNEDTV